MVSKKSLLTDEHTSKRLGGIRQRDTAAEVLVQNEAKDLGLEFTTTNRNLPGSPDLANQERKQAVFVHGCYWHRHLGCKRTTTPKRNTSFWQEKFDANVARDARVTQELKDAGYKVLIVWECQAEQQGLLRRLLQEAFLDDDVESSPFSLREPMFDDD